LDDTIEEDFMSRRYLWQALCVAVLVCSPAVADVGSLSLTLTPLQTPGTLDIDLTLTATTTGASAPATSDAVLMFGSFYYPTPYGSQTTLVSSQDSTVYRTGVTNVFENTFSFTLPNPGHWGYYGFVYGVTQDSYSTYEYQYGTMDIAALAIEVPTATLPGMLLFGALLAGIGVFLLFRS
jgi:hypothetical protein